MGLSKTVVIVVGVGLGLGGAVCQRSLGSSVRGVLFPVLYYG